MQFGMALLMWMKYPKQKMPRSRSRLSRCASHFLVKGVTFSYFHFKPQLFCLPQSLGALGEAIENASSIFKVTVQSAEIAYIPNDRFPSVDDHVKKGVKDLKEDLEARDDVYRVWTSLD